MAGSFYRVAAKLTLLWRNKQVFCNLSQNTNLKLLAFNQDKTDNVIYMYVSRAMRKPVIFIPILGSREVTLVLIVLLPCHCLPLYFLQSQDSFYIRLEISSVLFSAVPYRLVLTFSLDGSETFRFSVSAT